MRRVAPLLVAATLGIVGCDTLFGPDGDGAVTLSASPTAMQVRLAEDGWPQAFCAVNFHAVGGEGSASWDRAVVRWYMGMDRLVPTDTEIVAAEEVRALWGSDAIARGETQTGGWELWAPYPFELEVEFTYGPNGSRSSTIRRQCGPKPTGQLDEPDAPVVAFIPNVGSYEPGDDIAVEFTASAPTGLWATVVSFYGAFERVVNVSEGLNPASGRTVNVTIPAASTLGASADVDVFAVDAFGRDRWTSASFGPLLDQTPPQLVVTASSRTMDPYSSEVDGPHFVGDSLLVRIQSSDNHRVRSVTWFASVGEHRDSILPEPDVLQTQVRIPLRPEWDGGVTLHFTARDSAGNTAASALTTTGFAVYPTIERSVQTLDVSFPASDAVVDPERDIAYVLGHDGTGTDTRIGVVSLETMTLTRTIPLKFRATSMDLSPSGDNLVLLFPSVGEDGQLTIIDLLRPEQAPTNLPLARFSGAHNSSGLVMIGAAGKAIVGSPFVDGQFRLGEVDLATGQKSLRGDGASPEPVTAIVRSLDRSAAFLVRRSCMQRYDMATDVLGPCGASIDFERPTVDLTGQVVAVALDVYDGNLAFLREAETVKSSSAPTTAALSPDGQTLYHVRDWVGLVRSRVSDGRIIDRSVLPSQIMPDHMVMASDGSYVVLRFGARLVRVSLVD